MRSIGVIDLFCGTGGFSHGFRLFSDRFSVLAAVDLDGIAADTMRANSPATAMFREDIRKVHPRAVSKAIAGSAVDVVIGGPPCQGFSSLRPNRSASKNDPRNSLFRQFAEYVRFFKPKVFVMENVVGLVTHRDGRTLQDILKCFTDMKYKVDWRILNAAHYGVPQKRERLILLGVRGESTLDFPEPTHRFDGLTIGYADKVRMIRSRPGLPKAVTVMQAIGDLPAVGSGETATAYTRKPVTQYQRDRRNGVGRLTLHTAANHSPRIMEIIRHAGDSKSAVPSHLVRTGFSSSYSRMRPHEPGTTITVKFMSAASSKCIHPVQDRAITPREAARIQGFDDDFVFCGSLTAVAAQIGNAVPPILGTHLAKAIAGQCF